MMWWDGKTLFVYWRQPIICPTSSTWVVDLTWHASTCSVRERGQVQMSLDSPLSTALQTPWFPQQSLVFARKFAWMHLGSKEPFVCCTGYTLFDWRNDWIVSSTSSDVDAYLSRACILPRWMIICLSFQRKPLPERLVRLGHCMLVPALGSSKQDDELVTRLKGKWTFVKVIRFAKVYSATSLYTVYYFRLYM